MSYKNDSYLVIMGSYDKAGSAAKAELFETYDRLRDLTVSGPALGGSGVGKFGSLLMNVARMIGGSPFLPTFGSEAINIPGTSYYSPMSGGTGILPGGQAAFGLAPFSNVTGITTGGAAPIGNSAIGPLSLFSALGAGSLGASALGFSGLGSIGFPMATGTIGGVFTGGASPIGGDVGALNGGFIAGGASGIGGAATAGGLALGTAAGAGFGRNWVMPAAGIVSGIGGLLTTLGPFFGPFGLAAAAGGSILSGVSGAVLSSFQTISNRLLVNADTILSSKIKNLETTVKQIDAQEEILRKLLKESVEGDKKALENI
ncbi:hypothetical protein [Vampirovibrio chlorellavorus]|uniref:hypothetical protein n=1 Tax=Vampirovibrio chlorellavorus TaxID=758823 RepID=UPI0026F0F071|nr:hypothetical protein [Vampirovibrio chlorellavorus]